MTEVNKILPLVIIKSYNFNEKDRRVDTLLNIMDERDIAAYVMDEYIDRFNISYKYANRELINVEDLDEVLDKHSLNDEYFEARIIVNRNWKRVTPTLEQLFEALEEREIILNTNFDTDDDDDEDLPELFID